MIPVLRRPVTVLRRPVLDLEGKRQGETWTVTFGAERSGCPSTAAWYKVLSVPGAASGQDTWKNGVSYWDCVGTAANIRYRRQWLWVFQRSRTCVRTAAKDYSFVKLPEMHVPWRARWDWTSVIRVDWSALEDPHQEQQGEPLASVHRLG